MPALSMDDPMARTYSRAFRRIKPAAIVATRRALADGAFRDSTPRHERVEIATRWVRELAEAYGMRVLSVRFANDEDESLGTYNLGSHTMTVNGRISLVTMAHEFRHAMQANLRVSQYRGDIEEDAVAWSHSLFRLAAPRSYRRALAAGRLFAPERTTIVVESLRESNAVPLESARGTTNCWTNVGRRARRRPE